MTAAQLAVWHATILEIAWTLIGLVGVYLCWNNLGMSKFNLTSLKTMNGHSIDRFTELRILAAGQWRNDVFRLTISLVIVVIGLVAVITPPVNQGAQPQPITPVAVAITIGFFIIEIVIVLSSVMDKMQRDMLYNYDDHKH